VEDAPNPFEAWGLDIAFVEWHGLEDAAALMDARCPRLTEEEIERIAQRVAAHLIEGVPERVPDSEKAQWRERLRSTTYDLAVGLASSGIWALLVYVAQIVDSLAPAEDEAYQERELRRSTIRHELSRNLPSDSRKDLVASGAWIRDETLRPVIDTLVGGLDEDNRTRGYRTYRLTAWEAAIAASRQSRPEPDQAKGYQRTVDWDVRGAMRALVFGLVEESSRKVLEAASP